MKSCICYHHLSLLFRTGEEWHRIRRILNLKLLKPKVTDGYAESLNDVASDLVTQMKAMRGTDGIIPSLQDELFKWSLECKLVIIKLHIIDFITIPMLSTSLQLLYNISLIESCHYRIVIGNKRHSISQYGRLSFPFHLLLLIVF